MKLVQAIKELQGYLKFGSYRPENIEATKSDEDRAYFDDGVIVMKYTKESHIIKLLFTLLMDPSQEQVTLSPVFEDVSFMVDCARNNALNEATCKHFIRCIPTLIYSETKVEDVDTDMEDHNYDEWRYVCMEHPINPRYNEAERRQLQAGEDPLDLMADKQAMIYDRYNFIRT